MATAALEILSSGQYTIHSHKETDEFGKTTSDGMNNRFCECVLLWLSFHMNGGWLKEDCDDFVNEVVGKYQMSLMCSKNI